jgi:hypothetical protein
MIRTEFIGPLCLFAAARDLHVPLFGIMMASPEVYSNNQNMRVVTGNAHALI